MHLPPFLFFSPGSSLTSHMISAELLCQSHISCTEGTQSTHPGLCFCSQCNPGPNPLPAICWTWPAVQIQHLWWRVMASLLQREAPARSADAARWERPIGSLRISNWQLEIKRLQGQMFTHWDRASWWGGLDWIRLMRRGGGFWCIVYLSSMHRQIKPQKVDWKDIKEGNEAFRRPPVLTIYI